MDEHISMNNRDATYVMPPNEYDGTNVDNHIAVANGAPDKKVEYIQPCGGRLGHMMLSFWSCADGIIESNKVFIILIIKCLAIAVVLAYIGFIIEVFISKGSPLDWCHDYGIAFILIAVIVWCIVYYRLIKTSFKLIYPYLARNFGGVFQFFSSNYTNIKYLICGIYLIATIGFVIYDTLPESKRLISLLGILVFILVGFIFSKHPHYIRWDTVLSGIAFQLLIGFLTIRTETGRNIFQCIGSTVVVFLEYGYKGAEFVYGDFLVNKQHVFAFQSLSVLFFLSMLVQVLFYLGWIQVFCFKLGSFLQFIIGTTVIESINAITTVFLGMSEAPLIYRPYIKDLTPSEVHCIMTSCFSTVAGTLLAAYTSLGVDPKYVVTASAMAAPASLAIGKLFYPENQRSKTSSGTISLYKSDDTSIMDAACKGAFAAIEIVTGIIACVAATVSMVNFLNGVTSWLGTLAGIEGLTIEYLLGQLFVPLAWVMGVIPEQCADVASLIGLKTFANEFVAYEKLGKLKAAGKLTVRSEAIVTFALCGFANPGSLAILIGFISSICPSQKENTTKVAIRAFVSGSITSFSSACIAGLLIPEHGFQ